MELIRTGSTVERYIRHGIFTTIVVVYAGLSYWDGWHKYAADNLRTLREELPTEARASVQVNPRVRDEYLRSNIGRDIKFDELVQDLGEPAWSGPDPAGGTKAVWFGPGGRLTVRYDSFKRLREGSEFTPGKHTETDIFFNQVMAIVLTPLAVVLLGHMLLMLIRRTEFSEAGLRCPGHPLIPFEAMVGWDIGEFRRKGRIRLEYDLGQGRKSVVLDDYKMKAFPDIVAEICRRKHYENPVQKPAAPAES